MTMLRTPCILLACLWIGACGTAGIPGDSRSDLAGIRQSREEVSVLFIGNSYSFGVPKAFGGICRENGRRVHVGQVTHNGWSLERHAADDASLRKLGERQWDVVVLQEQSRRPSLPVRRAWKMRPAVAELAAKVRGRGGVPVLYQTWGYRDGDPKVAGDDFHAMTRRVREGYRKTAEETGNLPVAPVGDAWEREVSAGRGARLFMPDGSHPTTAGNALSGEVIYQTIFGR